MPKKTKKEKLLAFYHKKIRLLGSKQTSTHATVSTTPSTAPMPIANQEIKISPINQYFFSDLKKSLILIILIIGLEITLYFVTMIK
jgi:hypothetical protein